ncbi:SatD family protein [Geochorda subterranea]|uniref:SatD family protein n=1 Tax=Geochorda subterranea TaxID=3109564 RepID=A0ABZ1BRT8_9FIRM|nr:SatD family protein [Limnochorda sp. LNt]WRP15522.1 SatD family protein [Limnochorda sp. LNt]
MVKPLVARWVVVTGDVVGSRRLEPRERLRDALEEALARFNQRWAHDLAVPFSLSAGDEVQGVVRPGPGAFAAVRRLRAELRRAPLAPGVRLRVGIGWGAIDTPFSAARSWEMDGEAFHLARQALAAAEAAQGRRGGAVEATRFAGPDGRHTAWVNVVLTLLDAILERWTAEQWEAVAAYERLGTYAAAAGELGVAPQNVQKRCAAARWPTVRGAERFLGETLEQALSDGEVHPTEGDP